MKIAKLMDGREFKFPDSMDDAQMDSFVRALLKAEETAARAEAAVKAMRDQLDALLARPRGKTTPATLDISGVVGELQSLRTDLNTGLAKMDAAQLADTVLVGEPGSATRSVKQVSRG